MSRREIREHLFRMLFHKEFHNQEELQEQIELYKERIENGTEEEVIYLENRLNQILEQLSQIDTIISEESSGWKINRMGKADLTILRLAVFELFYDNEIPSGVAINEAVEIAKKYGGEHSSAFINGVLAKIEKRDVD